MLNILYSTLNQSMGSHIFDYFYMIFYQLRLHSCALKYTDENINITYKGTEISLNKMPQQLHMQNVQGSHVYLVEEKLEWNPTVKIHLSSIERDAFIYIFFHSFTAPFLLFYFFSGKFKLCLWGVYFSQTNQTEFQKKKQAYLLFDGGVVIK